MATTTPVNGWSIPQLTDPPNITTAVNSFANGVDARANPIFSTTSARAAAIPSPTAGQECFVTATGEKYIYNGSSWVGMVWRRAVSPSTVIVNNSTTLVNVGGLSMSLEANSIYRVDCIMPIQSNSAPDFRFQFTCPAGVTGFCMAAQWNQLTAPNGIRDTQVFAFDAANRILGATDGTLEYLTLVGDLTTTGTSGTLQFQFAQAVANVSNTSVYFGATITALKLT